jgi:AcrR family transcriptional regulator
MIDTKERILDAAERQFAENGYLATSLRRIMNEANVNVASIHYYFRSKESLLEAVLVRRAEPANQERLEMLDRFEREARNGQLSVEQVLEAFLVPTMRMASDPARGGDDFLRLMGRLHAESDLLPGIILVRFRPVLLRFAEALARALPELPPAEIYFRARLAMGAAAQVFRDANYRKKWAQEDSEGKFDWRPVLDRLVSYLSAGFRAPVVEIMHEQEMR